MAISPFIIEANKYEPKMRSALIKAFNELRTQESRAAIVRALQEGGIDGVMRLFENIEPKIAAQLSPVIDQALGAGAALPATMIPAGAFLNKDVAVSLYNQATVSYLERYKLDLIQQIGRNTREAVRTSLIADQIAGVNPVETARNFRNTLGLTEKQEQSVRNYKGYLENLDRQALQRELRDKRHDSVISRAIADQKPLTPEQIEKMTNRYREKYIKYRAETIARTEALRAVSIGNRAALDQMINNADVDTEKLRRFWHYTGDSRTRQAHRDIPGMNKEGRRLDEPFQTPLGPLMFPRDPSGSSANTVQCRCVEYYRLILNGVKQPPHKIQEYNKPTITVNNPLPEKDLIEVKPKVNPVAIKPEIKTKIPEGLTATPVNKPKEGTPKLKEKAIKVEKPDIGNFTKLTKPLTNDEKTWLNWYSSDGFRELNDYCINPGSYGKTQAKHLEKFKSSISSSISKNTLTKDATFYRGVNSKAFKNLIESGDLKELPITAFQSASTSHGIAKTYSGFDGVILKIRAKKGINVLDMNKGKLSLNKTEAEVLLPATGKYKIVETKQVEVATGLFRTEVTVDYER